jgi:hypothetical protein
MPLSNDWNKKSVCKCETTISTVGFTNWGSLNIEVKKTVYSTVNETRRYNFVGLCKAKRRMLLHKQCYIGYDRLEVPRTAKTLISRGRKPRNY